MFSETVKTQVSEGIEIDFDFGKLSRGQILCSIVEKKSMISRDIETTNEI